MLCAEKQLLFQNMNAHGIYLRSYSWNICACVYIQQVHLRVWSADHRLNKGSLIGYSMTSYICIYEHMDIWIWIHTHAHTHMYIYIYIDNIGESMMPLSRHAVTAAPSYKLHSFSARWDASDGICWAGAWGNKLAKEFRREEGRLALDRNTAATHNTAPYHNTSLPQLRQEDEGGVTTDGGL